MNPPNILLAEDNLETRELYAQVLKEAGFTVITVTDGEEALDEVKKDRYQLILLDMMMPIINGVQFLKQLKTIQLAHPPRVVLLTNLANEQVIDEAVKEGAYSYLIKSDLTPGEFTDRVRKILEIQ